VRYRPCRVSSSSCSHQSLGTTGHVAPNVFYSLPQAAAALASALAAPSMSCMQSVSLHSSMLAARTGWRYGCSARPAGRRVEHALALLLLGGGLRLRGRRARLRILQLLPVVHGHVLGRQGEPPSAPAHAPPSGALHAACLHSEGPLWTASKRTGSAPLETSCSHQFVDTLHTCHHPACVNVLTFRPSYYTACRRSRPVQGQKQKATGQRLLLSFLRAPPCSAAARG